MHSTLILDTNRQIYQIFKYPVIFYIIYNILCQLEYMYVCPISASILNYLLKVLLLLDLNFLKYSCFHKQVKFNCHLPYFNIKIYSYLSFQVKEITIQSHVSLKIYQLLLEEIWHLVWLYALSGIIAENHKFTLICWSLFSWISPIKFTIYQSSSLSYFGLFCPKKNPIIILFTDLVCYQSSSLFSRMSSTGHIDISFGEQSLRIN